MTPLDWIGAGLAVASLGVAVGGYLLNRNRQKNAELTIAREAGADRQRLDTLERWQQNSSVDRSEFVDLKAEVVEVKGDVSKIGDTVRGVELQMAAIPAELKSIRDLMERDGREQRHDIAGLKAGMDKLTDLLLKGQRT